MSLFAAASTGELKEVQELIESGKIDVNVATHPGGKTALHFACDKGHLDVIMYLVSIGCAKEKLDSLGQTALFVACVSHRLSVVQWLHDHAGCDLDQPDHAGMTPIHMAAKLGRLSMVQYLCDQGAEVEKPTNAGRTPLITGKIEQASENGHLEVVRYLVEQGARKEQADSYGRTPLYSAVCQGRLAVVQFLVEQSGVDKDKADKGGMTPLHVAARWGHLTTLHYLLEQGAFRLGYDENGETFVDAADPKIRSHVRLASLLIDMDQPDSATTDRATVLALVLDNQGCVWFDLTRQGFPEAQIRSLVKHFPKELLQLTDTHGQTALHVAASRGHLSLVQFFLAHGADKNESDAMGRTPLHTATEHGHEAVVKYLLAQGADKDKADLVGYTPLQSAAQYHQDALQECLRESGGGNGGSKTKGWSKIAVAVVMVGVLALGLALGFLGHNDQCRAWLQAQGWSGLGTIQAPVLSKQPQQQTNKRKK